jgi:hypothetical protein
MSTERAACLIAVEVEARNLRMGEIEVLVALRIRTERRIVNLRREIDRSTLCKTSASDHRGIPRNGQALTLFQRPTMRAPVSSGEPSVGLSSRNLLNSGTNCSNWRKTRNEPSLAHAGRVLKSPVSPTRKTPGSVTV